MVAWFLSFVRLQSPSVKLIYISVKVYRRKNGALWNFFLQLVQHNAIFPGSHDCINWRNIILQKHLRAIHRQVSESDVSKIYEKVLSYWSKVPFNFSYSILFSAQLLSSRLRSWCSQAEKWKLNCAKKMHWRFVTNLRDVRRIPRHSPIVTKTIDTKIRDPSNKLTRCSATSK